MATAGNELLQSLEVQLEKLREEYKSSSDEETAEKINKIKHQIQYVKNIDKLKESEQYYKTRCQSLQTTINTKRNIQNINIDNNGTGQAPPAKRQRRTNKHVRFDDSQLRIHIDGVDPDINNADTTHNTENGDIITNSSDQMQMNALDDIFEEEYGSNDHDDEASDDLLEIMTEGPAALVSSIAKSFGQEFGEAMLSVLRTNQPQFDNDANDISQNMRNKILTQNMSDELKKAHTFSGTKFSGEGRNIALRAAEFYLEIRNFHQQGINVFGFNETQAIRSIRNNGFTGSAAQRVNQQDAQLLTNFNEFYKWFTKAWSLSDACQELHQELCTYKIPDQYTPIEMINHLKDRLKLLDYIHNESSVSVRKSTTITPKELIDAVVAAMCPSWQELYHNMCRTERQWPLRVFEDDKKPEDVHIKSLEELMTQLYELIVQNNIGNPNKIPTKHSTENSINYLNNPTYTPQYNNPYSYQCNQYNRGRSRGNYRGRGRGFRGGYRGRRGYGNYWRGSRGRRGGYYNNQNNRNSNSNQDGPDKFENNNKGKVPEYGGKYFCDTCQMGGHSDKLHNLFLNRYPRQMLDYNIRWHKEQMKNKNDVNHVKTDDTNNTITDNVTDNSEPN